MKISIASDYKAFDLKEKVAMYLASKQVDFIDCGCFNTDVNDYMDFGKIAVENVLKKKSDLAILMCFNGYGMCIYANRFKGIRGIIARSQWDAEVGRQYDDSNVLCLGSGVTSIKDAKKIIDTFLKIKFESNERRLRRNKKLDK